VGRIKTSFIKHIAKDLFEKYSEKFTTDFEKNKEVVKQLAEIKSKRIRNIVAGYLTSLKKREKTKA
jgi:small subunit ribosomal protein S17e